MLGGERLEAVVHGIFDGAAIGRELGVGDVETVVVARAVGGILVLQQVGDVVQPDAAVDVDGLAKFNSLGSSLRKEHDSCMQTRVHHSPGTSRHVGNRKQTILGNRLVDRTSSADFDQELMLLVETGQAGC